MTDQNLDVALPLLTGDDATDILDTALASAGGRVVEWSVRDVDHRPGRRTTASYDAHVEWPDGVREEIMGASVSTDRPSDGLVVTDGDQHIQIWRYPYDPQLPGLAVATIPSAISQVLMDLGLTQSDDVELNVISYRPLKRAVIEVTTASRKLFLKVMRPKAAKAVHARHELLASADLPVPHSLACTNDGIVILDALPGTPLRDVLGAGGSIPDPADVTALLDRLPAEVSSLPRRTPWADHAGHYAGVVASVLPAAADRAHTLGRDIETALADCSDGSEPTHGDFYDAQLMVSGGTVTGLLDVDALGPGRRADDLACALAHLTVLITIPPYAASARAALERWTPIFAERVDENELRARTAGVILSLATGPFRTQDPGWEAATIERLALAESWLRSGHQLSERALISIS